MKHIDLREKTETIDVALTILDAVTEIMKNTVKSGTPHAVQMTNNHNNKPLTLEISVKIVER